MVVYRVPGFSLRRPPVPAATSCMIAYPCRSPSAKATRMWNAAVGNGKKDSGSNFDWRGMEQTILCIDIFGQDTNGSNAGERSASRQMSALRHPCLPWDFKTKTKKRPPIPQIRQSIDVKRGIGGRPFLDAHTDRGIAPLGVAEQTISTYLNRICGTWRQAVD